MIGAMTFDRVQGDWAVGDLADYDRCVAESDDVDPFCCSSDWVLPARALVDGEGGIVSGDREPIVARDGDCWVLLDRHHAGDGSRVLTAFEPAWGFACPVIGADVTRSAALLLAVLRTEREWDMAVLSGFVVGSRRWSAVVQALTGAFARLAVGEDLIRQVADLSDGFDAWYGRRSQKFRAGLRRTRRIARERGITTAPVDENSAEFWDVVAAVESRSWKGKAGGGLTSPEFVAFYRAIAGRVAPEGRWRARLAVHEHEPVGFIFGAVRAGRYRGFQLSYAQEEAQVSIGNLLQYAELERLASEGIMAYDLGMDMDYKQRWADSQLVTRSLFVLRR